MSDHHHNHSPKNIKTAFLLNLLFAIIELIGGWYTNSIAIISDAVHDFGDSLSLGVAWYFQKIAKKGVDQNYSYGYKRFSLLGAIINALVLTVGSMYVIIEAIPRLFDPVMPNATGMIYLALLGIFVNGIAAFRLSHGHSINERVVYLHLLEDILGWVATLIVALVLQFRAIPILDPILSLLIAIYILLNVFKNIKKSFVIILQGTPDKIKPEKINLALKEIEEIKDMHDCHVWSMDGHYHILSMHIVVDNEKSMTDLSKIKKIIKQKLSGFNIDHITIEFETSDEECQPC